ncbi:hypothetical protein FOZ61_007293 [Perkinsus olseni]|uniref:Uncharacterized protein n=1 Tax=Perkinsus olseni TaxID=32597 RepID=A0A7J6M904_PEROL|nr:hypothetical protein FOZ61_007293 [Perkinsus olseni]
MLIPAALTFVALLKAVCVEGRSNGPAHSLRSSSPVRKTLPELEDGTIGNEVPPTLLRIFGKNIHGRWCSIKGNVDGENAGVYLKHHDAGNKLFNLYTGDPLALDDQGILPEGAFPHAYDDNCRVYYANIHSDWYQKDEKYRAAVDGAAADGASIADVFIQRFFEKYGSRMDAQNRVVRNARWIETL